MKKNIWYPGVLLEGFILMLTIGILYGCDNNDLIVVINEPTNVLAAPSLQEYEKGSSGPPNVVTVLKKGETAEVIGKEYGKSYLAYKIRLSDGRTGYIISYGDKFRVVHR